MKGYGHLIAERRKLAGMSEDDLGRLLGKSKHIVYRIEAEVQEPTFDQIQVLLTNLPLTPLELLVGLGLGPHLSLPVAGHIQKSLLELLPQLEVEGQQAVERVAQGQLALQLGQRQRAARRGEAHGAAR